MNKEKNIKTTNCVKNNSFNEKNKNNKPVEENISRKELFKIVFIAFIFAFCITRIIEPTLVSGNSMNPTLNNKNYLLTNKLEYKFNEPKQGDIIIFRTKLEKSKVLIKRVIGLPGDKVVITKGNVFINGEQLEEGYINGDYTIGEIEQTVEDGKVFVMGDNRGNSLDSRFNEVGQVNQDDIIGKAFLRIFPMKSFK